MVPFAGYEMPVQYPVGILAEHLQTRTRPGCSMFRNGAGLPLRP